MLVFVFIVALYFVSGEIQNVPSRINLRVLTMNTWQAGGKVENGLNKIVKHIRALHADIVFLQEMNAKAFDELMKKLGNQWSGQIHLDHKESKPAIVTKHKIVADTKFYTNWTFGLTIFHDSGMTLNVVNVHLNYRDYGPELLDFAKRGLTSAKLVAPDFRPDGRFQNILDLSAHPSFKNFVAQTSAVPLILAGDFNEPSHLDWTIKTSHLHKNLVVEWPVTKHLSEKVGLIDTFRHLRPDASAEPGNTWSSVWDEAFEPSDRIDFVFYKSDQMKPIRSFIYSGTEQLKKLPEKYRNVDTEELDERDWSSDHYSVVTDFVMHKTKN
ncbi:hypothetical protein niasHS_017328 [Heterodera schachtii]|uniref:Endonuclease/exonuclease/phosphatase domain-containing protein n=1 Tax=Heterodera schachtii TaxID=97005 RepID=A0ABD2HTP5_HETSC